MTFEELEELMQEPPGGENHGRVRTASGWRSFEETYETDLPYVIVDPEYRAAHTYKHGTLSRYQHDRCRCALCKEAKRLWQVEYRKRKREQASRSSEEPTQ